MSRSYSLQLNWMVLSNVLNLKILHNAMWRYGNDPRWMPPHGFQAIQLSLSRPALFWRDGSIGVQNCTPGMRMPRATSIAQQWVDVRYRRRGCRCPFLPTIVMGKGRIYQPQKRCANRYTANVTGSKGRSAEGVAELT